MKITSNHGFYIGDIKYVLPESTYKKLWDTNTRRFNTYADSETGLSLCFVELNDCDVYLYDNDMTAYGIESNDIGIIPLELIDEKKYDNVKGLCRVEYITGTADIKYSNKTKELQIILPDETTIIVDTEY